MEISFVIQQVRNCKDLNINNISFVILLWLIAKKVFILELTSFAWAEVSIFPNVIKIIIILSVAVFWAIKLLMNFVVLEKNSIWPIGQLFKE